jgi:hypothetical protein
MPRCSWRVASSTTTLRVSIAGITSVLVLPVVGRLLGLDAAPVGLLSVRADPVDRADPVELPGFDAQGAEVPGQADGVPLPVDGRPELGEQPAGVLRQIQSTSAVADTVWRSSSRSV